MEIPSDGKTNLELRLTLFQLKMLYKWLDIPLHGEDVRVRSRFLKMISPILDGSEHERLTLLKEFAKKDGDGNPVFLKDEKGEPTDNFDLSVADLKKFQKRMAEVNGQEHVVPLLTKDQVSDVRAFRQILEKQIAMANGFSLEEGEIYDQVCMAFKSV